MGEARGAPGPGPGRGLDGGPGQPAEAWAEALGCDVDGPTVRVPEGLQGGQVLAAVEALGRRALVAAGARPGGQDGAAEALDRARLRLRLRRMVADPRVAPVHVREACCRLVEQADALRHALEGSSVRVGFANRVAEGAWLELAWDFEF
jgi:hypothetical protein